MTLQPQSTVRALIFHALRFNNLKSFYKVYKKCNSIHLATHVVCPDTLKQLDVSINVLAKKKCKS